MIRCVCVIVLALSGQFTQRDTGELRLRITDPGGLPLNATVELVSDAAQIRETRQTDAAGVLIARGLAFGTYRLAVTRDGFAPFAGSVDIRSALPTEYHVVLSLAAVQTQVVVTPGDTLLDRTRAASVQRLGADALQQRAAALPGRSLPDLVSTQPGWLLEANGVLHPRGSEYQTQFVLDGLPLTDNRSPAFAPAIDADDVHTMSILTGGYPAEYGRKLGGVIEVATAAEAQRGFHASASASLGSFSTGSADAIGAYSWAHVTVSVSGGGATTDRYLDPPVEENFTNHGTTAHVAARMDADLTAADRFGAIVRNGRTRFGVPNERPQQDAGQIQTRDGDETMGQFSYQHVFAAPLLADVRGMVRDLSAGLASNERATPIIAEQQRGFREVYGKGAISGHVGAHEWRTGGDVSAGTLRERFRYRITEPEAFDPATPAFFAFDERRADREEAVFIQDQIRFGRWTINAGIRWDHYSIVVDESATSPRAAVAWSPSADVVVRASYDRAFQTPAFENLLLASSPAVDTLDKNVARLPVRPSRGNFYEAGITKALAGFVRVDAAWFDRRMDDFADDDLLLNTGVSFPIAFSRAAIRGAELKLDVPRWRAFSGSLSYSWMRGTGTLPVTGGLFLGDDMALLTAAGQAPVSQDQRHTVHGRISCQLTPSAWVAAAATYGSGLPVEFDGDREQAAAQYGERIVDRVDFDAGRVKPWMSLDASLGVAIRKSGRRMLQIQIDGRNLTDRLDLINFAGLFSGTAIAPPRSVTVRVRAGF